MSKLNKASIRNLHRNGPPPMSYVLGDPTPWGAAEPEIELEPQEAKDEPCST